jgi:hypothetical protein
MVDYTKWKAVDLILECQKRKLAIGGNRSHLVSRLAQDDAAKRAAAIAARDIPSLNDYNSDNDPQGTQRIEILRQEAAFVKGQNKLERDEEVAYHDRQASYHATRHEQHKNDSAAAKETEKDKNDAVDAECRGNIEALMERVQERVRKRAADESAQLLEQERRPKQERRLEQERRPKKRLLEQERLDHSASITLDQLISDAQSGANQHTYVAAKVCNYSPVTVNLHLKSFASANFSSLTRQPLLLARVDI